MPNKTALIPHIPLGTPQNHPQAPYNTLSNFDCALDLAHSTLDSCVCVCVSVCLCLCCVYVCVSVMIGGYCVRHAPPGMAACCCGFDTGTAAKDVRLLACELNVYYMHGRVPQPPARPDTKRILMMCMRARRLPVRPSVRPSWTGNVCVCVSVCVIDWNI